ncbi:MAG: AI-2E family transporter [Pseudomonadota bacterium]
MPSDPIQPNPEVRPSQVTLKTVFTVCLGILIVVALVMAAVHSVLAITLTCAALMLAIALEHGVQMLVRRRVKRSPAIAVVALSLMGAFTGLGFTLIPPAVSQGKALVHNAPGLIRTARGSAWFQRLDDRFQVADRIKELEQNSAKVLEGAATPLLAAVGGVLSFVGAAITIFFLTIFMLVFGGRLIKAALAEARPERRPIYDTLLAKIYQSIGGYLGGLTLICAINATLTTVFLAINRMPFFLPLGILSGLSSMIPYAGPFITGAFISVLALATGGLWHGVASGIYFVLYGQLEGNVLGPLIFRRTVHVNPLVVTLSILFLGEIAGVVGAIAAVPLIATLQIVLRELLLARREHLALQRAAERDAARPPPPPPPSPTPA